MEGGRERERGIFISDLSPQSCQACIDKPFLPSAGLAPSSLEPKEFKVNR